MQSPLNSIPENSRQPICESIECLFIRFNQQVAEAMCQAVPMKEAAKIDRMFTYCLPKLMSIPLCRE